MASALPPILVEIQADVAQLKKGLADATTAIKGMDDNVKQANTGMSNFISKLKTVGATLGATFAATQITQFAKDTVMAASNMAESVSKVAVVFGEGAAEVYKFGETAAEKMGISNQAALEAAGTYGNLFQAFGMGQGEAQKMSTSLVQLASDMASFNNTSVDDAILALRSGLSGETEPLKKFGVALNDVRLRAEAAALGLGEYKGVLPPLVKSQAAYSLIMKDTALAQGDYERTASGTANTMKTLQAKFEDAKVAVGDALMPAFRGLLKILELLIPVIKAIGDFFKKYQADIKAFAIGVGIATAAWGAYKIATNLAAIATKAMEIAQKGLNAALKANPIGLIITAVGLLAVGIKRLWDNSETFRKVVISVAKAALQAFASIIPMVAQVFEAIMKIVTGPMRLFLTALSKLPGVGKYAKSGLDMINKGLDGISDFGKKAADKANELSKKLDSMAKIAKKAGEEVDKATKGPKRPPAADVGAAEAAKKEEERLKKVKKLNEDLAEVYKDINQVIADANDKANELLETRNERIADAHERYKERVADLNERYNEQIAEAEERHTERVTEAYERFNEQNAEATKRYNEEVAEANKRYREAEANSRKRNVDTLLKISKDYTKKELELQKNLEEKLADLKTKAIDKTADLTAKAAEKQAGIIQQSINRLTSAFASGTAVNIGDLFKKGKEGDLLGTFKKQLEDVKALQAAAGELAGAGYSQTFIEQVVKAGPEAGLEMMKQIKGLSPEQQAELKTTFAALETINDSGLDKLATSMNEGANLATSELRKAYEQVAVDLRESLATVDRELQEGMAEANKIYQENLTAAKQARDEALTEAATALEEALTEAKKNLDEALAEASKSLFEAQAKAKKELETSLAEAAAEFAKSRQKAQEDLNKGLAKAQEELQKALLDAQAQYEKALDKLNKVTQDKLNELNEKIIATMEALRQLAALQAALYGAKMVSQFNPFTPQGLSTTFVPTGTTLTNTNTPNNTTVNITGVNLTSPQQTAAEVVNGIKFGNVVVPSVPARLQGESGAIGAAYMSSNTKIDPAYVAMRAR